MNKVYLHIGSPKTGTTSLQNDFFDYIDGINYIGKKDEESDYFKTLVYIINSCSQDEFYINLDFVRNALVKDISDSSILISDESFVVTTLSSFGEITVSEKIRRLGLVFEGFDVDFILTIRDQKKAVFSLYTELYPTYNSYFKVNSFNEMLLSKKGVVLDSFDYYKIYKNIEGNFKDFKITFLSFEMFLNDHRCYLNAILEFIGLEPDIQRIVSHDNKKRKFKDYVLTDELTLKRWVELLVSSRMPWLKNILHRNIFFRTIVRRLWRFLSIFLLLKSNRRFEIQNQTEEDKAFIHSEFVDSNRELCIRFPYLKKVFENYDYPF